MKEKQTTLLKPVGPEYDDIINLAHPTSKKHPRMAISDRAAQFSPFAALTGYEDAIDETARVTADKVELEEDRKEQINEVLYEIKERIQEQPYIRVTYFEPDQQKEGGSYKTISGRVRKFDLLEGTMILTSGQQIIYHDITDLQQLPPTVESCSVEDTL